MMRALAVDDINVGFVQFCPSSRADALKWDMTGVRKRHTLHVNGEEDPQKAQRKLG